MDFTLLALALGALWFLNRREQLRRIHLLAGVLGQYQVEKLMETVADGYLRALGEADAERSLQVWNMLGQAERTLCAQVQAFVRDFDRVDAQAARFSTLPVALPFATLLFAGSSADLRALLRVHAEGIVSVVDNAAALPRKEQAYMLTAELLLLQHSCQWYCRSKATASARMLARHQTPYRQLLTSISPQTRKAYGQLLGV